MTNDLESGHEKLAMSDDSHNDQRHNEPGQTAVEPQTKNNVVDWDGPDDPQNPMNWPAWKRFIQVILGSLFLLTA